MEVSIIIPTCGSYHLLDACLRGIYKNTTVSNLEIIIVCNGSDHESAMIALNNGLELIWYKDAIGFTKATNAGLKLVTKPITLIMNTDAHVMDYWPKDEWLKTLIKPLDDEKIGITGLATMRSEWGEFIPFYCTAIKSRLFNEIGLLDENFSPGYGEDLDFCIRAKNAGYEIATVTDKIEDPENQMNISSFPLYHRGEQSFSKEQRNWCLQNAHDVLNWKWGNKIF